MKFSYSLQFNTVPEWTEDYLSYGQLKKTIHDVETARLEESKGLVEEPSDANVPAGAASVSMGSRSSQLESEFLSLFQSDAQRVATAFTAKKLASNSQYDNLMGSVSAQQSSDVSVNKIEVWTGDDESLEKRRASLESSFNSVYLNLHDLHDFLDLNYTGYVRVVKNYGKYLHVSAEAKRDLLSKIDSILPIAELSELQGKMGQVEEVYARVMCEGSITQARAALHLLLRDRLATLRQSVLPAASPTQEIVKSAPIAMAAGNTSGVSVNSAAPAKAAAPYFTSSKVISMAAISIVFVLILIAPRGFFGAEIVDERQRALAILISCVSLWITEAIPLYVTALLIPALTIVLGVIERDALHIPAGAAAPSAKVVSDFVFKVIFSDMIFLLLGGFSIAAVLEKSGLTRMAAVSILKVFGKTPASTLLTVMVITVLASALVSNVAAPVLCFGLIQPILKNLDYDSPLARALILGIAFGANIGGLASPIASPQSVFGFARVKNFFSFGSWIAMALPICLVSTLFCWFWLRLMYPSKEVLNFKEIFSSKTAAKTMSPGKQIYILAVFAITVVLWIFAANLEKYLGPMGVTAVFPIVAYFGAGLLGKDDFNGFSWNVVILALGGSALGKTLDYSGLLKAIGNIIGRLIGDLGFLSTLCIFSGILLFITTFVSHSVGAFVFIPVIIVFSSNRSDSNIVTACLALAACFTCSAGMAMPISGFPNMTAASQQDRKGRSYVTAAEFSKGGIVPSIVFAASIVLTVYFLGHPLAAKTGVFE